MPYQPPKLDTERIRELSAKMTAANDEARKEGRPLPYPPPNREQVRLLRQVFGLWHWNKRLVAYAEKLAADGRKITNEDVDEWERHTGYSRGEFRHAGEPCTCHERKKPDESGEST